MAALTLAQLLARVKRKVPSTLMDTELQDHIIERMNFLVTADCFPFQEGYQSVSLAAGGVSVATPDNFASVRSLVVYTATFERPLTYVDPVEFDKLFPNVSNIEPAEPKFYTIKVAEGAFYFDCPATQTLTLYCYFYKIPDDATDTTVSQLTELAKLTLVDWAAADGFRDMKEFDRANLMEAQGDKKFAAMKRRYQLSRENDSRFVSLKEFSMGQRGY